MTTTTKKVVTIASVVEDIRRLNPLLGQGISEQWKRITYEVRAEEAEGFAKLQQDLFTEALKNSVPVDLEQYFTNPDFFFPKVLAQIARNLGVVSRGSP